MNLVRIGSQSRKQKAGNKTCRLFGAARGNHSRRTAITVNRSRWRPARRQPVSRKERSVMFNVAEHVDALPRTLAPESRHIVASGLLGTTSRAVVPIL